MLILLRRPGESLMIGDDVTVTILGVRGYQVHVGVTRRLGESLMISDDSIMTILEINGNQVLVGVIRRTNESLMISDDVSVTILGVRGYQVRVGVDAPRKIGVHRQEVYDRIVLQNGEEDRHIQRMPALAR